jgi:general secretion pathway protein G
MQKRRRRRQGMTLIELMAVMVIMATMASAVALGVMKYMEDARRRETQTRARAIQSGAIAYLMDTPGECPGVEELTRRNILDSTTDARDGWGHAFTIDCEDDTVHVRSRGKDGQFGTEDDLGF